VSTNERDSRLGQILIQHDAGSVDRERQLSQANTRLPHIPVTGVADDCLCQV
jgi:hypothetical protein